MPYQIVTDATFDLTPDLLEDLPALTVIPMDVIVGDESFLYGPGGDLTTAAFYKMQRKGAFASTSQITPDRFRGTFTRILDEGSDILYLAFTSGMSGTFQNAFLTAQSLKEDYPDREILCIDTLCASAGLGFLVHEALKKQASGMALQELADWVTDKRLHVCHWFSVDTFDHLRHGGRVSAAAAAIGSVLNIKPLLRVDDEGRLEVTGKPRGMNQAIASKLKHMEEDWMPREGTFVLIAHGDNPEGAALLKEKLSFRFPEAAIGTTEIGPVIGSHTGPGMLAVLYWGTHR